MFQLFFKQGTREAPRLVAQDVLSSDDFDAIAVALNVPLFRARKIGRIAARKATRAEPIVTHWNGIESTDIAEPGDWIITNLNPSGAPLRDRDGNFNVYVIRATKFPKLYARGIGASEHGAIYTAISTVEAIPLPGGFEILASWCEVQRAPSGFLLRNGSEVYGNNAETFAATYERI